MEATYAALCRMLGNPARELQDVAYRRLRWRCGCTAVGRSSQKMLVTLCLRHQRQHAVSSGGYRADLRSGPRF
jgi:hypothetical protein